MEISKQNKTCVQPHITYIQLEGLPSLSIIVTVEELAPRITALSLLAISMKKVSWFS